MAPNDAYLCSISFLFQLVKPATEHHVPDAWGDHRQSLVLSPQQNMIGNDYPFSLKRDSLFLNRDAQHDSQVLHSRLSPYGQDPALYRFSGLGNMAGGVITKVCIHIYPPSPLNESSHFCSSLGTNGA